MRTVRRTLSHAALGALLAVGASASAQTQSYAQKTKTIRAAVVLLDSDRTASGLNGQTASPYAFYGLDSATGIKPAGWTFTNPYAPGFVTQDIATRYNDLPLEQRPTLGTPIGKRNGAYWGIRLAALSESQMGDYDVLLIAPRYALTLNAVERERLRRFVDGGGVLWVDLQGISPGVYGNLPVALGASIDARVGNENGVAFDSSDPLFKAVRSINDSDLRYVNQGTTSIGFAATAAFQLSDRGEMYRYRTVASVPDNGGTYHSVMAEARVGDGAIIVTARGASFLLSVGRQSAGANAGYLVREDFKLGAEGRAAARLAANIVSLGGNYRQPAGGSRKSGSATTDPGSPVLTRFSVDNSLTYAGVALSGAPTSAPVTYKGFLVTTMGNRIVVFDAVPGRDLDGDGDEDDGIVDGGGNLQNGLRDNSVGLARDVVWISAPIGNGPLSSPVCAEVPEAARLGRDLVDQILVTDAAGTVHSFALAPKANFRLLGGVHAEAFQIAPPPSASGPGADPVFFETDESTGVARIPAPTVHEGLAFVADATSAFGSNPQGRVWVADLARGAQFRDPNSGAPWRVGGSGTSGATLPNFTASPTVGYVPSPDSTGGVDRIVYAPGVVANGQPAFASLWFGAKGEAPESATVDGSLLRIVTRSANNAQRRIYIPTTAVVADYPLQTQLAPSIAFTDTNGNAVAPSSLGIDPATLPTIGNPGELSYTTSNPTALQTFINGGGVVRVSYTLDWGANPAQQTQAIERGRIVLPTIKPNGISAGDQRIKGSIALTTRGTLHFTQGSNNPAAPGGTYWAMREDFGRGQFRVVSRFTLNNAYSQAASNGAQPVPPVLDDRDGLSRLAFQSTLPALLNTPLTNFRFSGGVAVRNGIVYAMVNAARGIVPVTIVTAFRAEPETPELKIGAGLPTTGIAITQNDYVRSSVATGGLQTATPSRLTGDAVQVDAENGIIRLESLASAKRGEISDSISLSQPIAWGDNRNTTYRSPDAQGDRWSPLLWYGLWNGATAKGTPLVAGNEVFFAADSVLPSLLSSGFTDFTSTGVVWSIDADTPTTGTYVTPSGTHPWLVQAVQVNPDTLTFPSSPYFRMPQARGATSFADYAVRLNQTKIGLSVRAFGVAGGEGVVAAYGNGGMYGMSRADFVVCDEGRLLRVDSSGNPVSNAFGGRFSGIGNGGGAVQYRPLVRPVKAYPVGESEFLVVDAAGNRVVRIDDDGTELRSIDRILLDPNHKPAEFRANEPLTLKDPRDAVTFSGYVRRGATEEVTNQQEYEYWVHTIIADGGNGRIIELVDRFVSDGQGRVGAPVTLSQRDPETGVTHDVAQVGVLAWRSPRLDSSASTGTYYNSISRVFVGALNGNQGRYVFVAGVGQTRPTGASVGQDNPTTAAARPSGSGGGAIVVFDPLGGTHVYDRFARPDLTATNFYNPATSQFNRRIDAPAQVDRTFVGVQSVSAATALIGNPGSQVAGIKVMVSDADAVYEFGLTSQQLAQVATPTSYNLSEVLTEPLWMINQTAYTAIRAIRVPNTSTFDVGTNAAFFRPAYARRLDSGDVLIVNGYRGLTRNGQSAYNGEVSLIEGLSDYGYGKDNLGFSLTSLRFELTSLNNTVRDLTAPVFADRR